MLRAVRRAPQGIAGRCIARRACSEQAGSSSAHRLTFTQGSGPTRKALPAPRDVTLRPGEAGGTFFFDLGTYAAPGAQASAAASEAAGGHGIRALARKHGVPFAVYYIGLTETLAVGLTLLLHYDLLGKGDITSVLKFLGIDGWLDVDGTMNRKKHFGPITISARLVTNFAFAKACIALLAPLKLPFCVATLPYVMRLMHRIAPRAAAAASGQKVAASPAAAAAGAAATAAGGAAAASEPAATTGAAAAAAAAGPSV
eukprot:CAMPEP_0174847526 /NCGR_PEP_ID=MMETSP1114-20130205/12964_1 /TAXON_ID=312471 /ORGANISM="Neobodo designis, Strain CCAP 1951/1" /LENGTH=256 /DNA_ID=CAMNT_0016081807 /DNA_START=41 /DNA_END=811 /DNA_ORIENTATION=+